MELLLWVIVRILMRDSLIGDWRCEALICLCKRVAGAMTRGRFWRNPTKESDWNGSHHGYQIG